MYLATGDYLWRWDADWFWCSSNFGAQHALVRRLLGRDRLSLYSDSYFTREEIARSYGWSSTSG